MSENEDTQQGQEQENDNSQLMDIENFERNERKKTQITKKPNRKNPEFGLYIYTILRQIDSDISIKRGVVIAINDILKHLLSKILAEAQRLTKYNGKHTMTSREINAAVNLILSEQLAEHAAKSGIIASKKYADTIEENKSKKQQLSSTEEEDNEKTAEKRTSRSQKAGVIFPVSKLSNIIREYGYAKRVGSTAPVFLSAVLDYMTFEIIESCIEQISSTPLKRITCKILNQSIHKDEDIYKSIYPYILRSGGNVVNTRAIPTKKSLQ